MNLDKEKMNKVADRLSALLDLPAEIQRYKDAGMTDYTQAEIDYIKERWSVYDILEDSMLMLAKTVPEEQIDIWFDVVLEGNYESPRCPDVTDEALTKAFGAAAHLHKAQLEAELNLEPN